MNGPIWGLIFAAQIYYFFPSFLGCQQMCYVSVKWVHILSDLYKFLFTITTPFVLALSIAIDDLNLESTLNYLSTLQYFENWKEICLNLPMCLSSSWELCVWTHGDGMWCRECLLCSLCQKRLTTRILTSIFSIPRFLIILQKLGCSSIEQVEFI